jgi:protoporphyrinogen oxidase
MQERKIKMHFYNLIKDISSTKKTILFVDMDGVIASYDLGKPYDFLNKRPLTSNIKKLHDISKLENVELHILSICRKDTQINEKKTWLNNYASFFAENNRMIISKESNPNLESKELKLNYLKNLNTDKQIILIDDDNGVLKHIKANLKNVILFQDSELID